MSTESPTLSLYYYDSCPFCVRVLRSARQLGAPIELRNILEDRTHRDDLQAARGRTTVPVLRIQENGEDRWMPESRDIVDYLQSRYG